MSTRVDIRAELPRATKGGTPSKPVWTIGDRQFKFVKPVNRLGLGADGRKPIIGKRLLATYVAGKTRSDKDLVFVGMFAEVPMKAAPASAPAATPTVAPEAPANPS